MENSSEIKVLVGRVIKQLNNFYDGNNWVTDNLEKKVFSLESSQALKKVQGHSHSIAQLIEHMTAWRNFVVQKLSGNSNYDIEDNSNADWPGPIDWIDTQKEFKNCHQKLRSNQTLSNRAME